MTFGPRGSPASGVRTVRNQQKGKAMEKDTVGQQNSEATEIYDEDHSTGQPVVWTCTRWSSNWT